MYGGFPFLLPFISLKFARPSLTLYVKSAILSKNHSIAEILWLFQRLLWGNERFMAQRKREHPYNNYMNISHLLPHFNSDYICISRTKWYRFLHTVFGFVTRPPRQCRLKAINGLDRCGLCVDE